MATVKGLSKGEGEKAKTLMTCCATPLESGYSPAQLLMGGQLRPVILHLPTSLLPCWPNIKRFKKKAKEKEQQCHNLHHRAQPLQPPEPGQKGFVPSKKKEVIQHATTPRSCILHTDDGQVRRNCAHTCTQYTILKPTRHHLRYWTKIQIHSLLLPETQVDTYSTY